MCGITGKLFFSNNIVTENCIRKMNDAVKHRGPDDSGVFISKDKKVGLGHQRLAIIDLSSLGHQPMEYLNRYWIVYNGEIYNYKEKKVLLEREGYRFKSQSDTEVILALYDRYGMKCLNYLRGMFAFAIYDEKEKTLFCARDRVGQKPFKYYIDNNVFIFASELKAILTQNEYEKDIDYDAIYHYLTLQYVPSPLTGFKGINKLEPGHFLFLDLRNKKLIKKRYWKLDYSEKLNLSENEWKRRIMDKLEEAVRLRMISDVPLGAFLSGGIDSSAVVGLMAKNSDRPVKTFNIAFDESKFDESIYAQMVAKKFRTDHTRFTVKLDAIEILPTLVKAYEEPFADSSALPTYYLSKLTRDKVIVALNGDGGDENFAGYDRYLIQKIGLMFDKLSPFISTLKPISHGLLKINPTVFTERLNRFIYSFSNGYDKRYFSYTSFFTEEDKKNLYIAQPNCDTYKLMSEKWKSYELEEKLDQTVHIDFSNYLPECLLVKVDIATMMVALEGRSPFLDHELLELTAKIPSSLKIKGDNLKYILKESLRGFVPDEVMDRPKQGFMIPIQTWFKGDLGNYTQNQLLDSGNARIKGFLNIDYIKELLYSHRKGNLNQGNKLWSLLTLELWLKEYF